jgi:hypothetical protein
MEETNMRTNWIFGFGMASLALAGATGLVATMTNKPAQAQVALPTPKRFVSALDLKCYRVTAAATPAYALSLRHLNPVLANQPVENVIVNELQELCVPVAKNNQTPPPDVLPFVRFVDLACHRITPNTTTGPFSLQISQLNPVLSTVPPLNVVSTVPQQLCVPVAKNNVMPPPDVLRLVQHIDLKCYGLNQATPLNRALLLSHLNPVLQGMGLSPEQVQLTNPEQLCVPVAKNNQPIPPDVLNIVRWVDLLMYRVATATPPLPGPVPLTLRQLNPLLTGLPPQPVQLIAPLQLGVPVAKNNVFPP